MIKALTAYTEELDDVSQAVADILAQIDVKSNLQKNTVGILSCHAEFVREGLVESICAKLPFDVIGSTTIGTAVPDICGQNILSLCVLTSDDVFFSTSVSEPIGDDLVSPLKKAYECAAEALTEKPAMILTVAPLLFHVGGDQIIEALNVVSGGVPAFGTLAVDHNQDYHESCTVLNGVHHRDALAMVLLSGNVKPRFYVASISENKIMKQSAVITESMHNILMGVNNVPVMQYMESLGLAKDGKMQGVNSIPFVIDYNDGYQPIVRAIFAVTPEGHMVCGGSMPVGSSLAVGTIDRDDVLVTTRKLLVEALSSDENSVLLMYSCVGRNLALEVDALAEMELIGEQLQGRLPYQFTYSGGEICPVHNEEGRIVNRFHNNTIVVCAL